MFNADELEALVVGTRFVRAFAGSRLATSAKAALLKIEAVLPPELREKSDRSRIFAPGSSDRLEATGIIDRLHAAVIDHHVLRMTYRDGTGSGTERDIEPLCLAFWGGAWTLGAWCRLRHGFRNFRPDRIGHSRRPAKCSPKRRARTRRLSARVGANADWMRDSSLDLPAAPSRGICDHRHSFRSEDDDA